MPLGGVNDAYRYNTVRFGVLSEPPQNVKVWLRHCRLSGETFFGRYVLYVHIVYVHNV